MKRLFNFFFQKAKVLTISFFAGIICCTACALENRLIMENSFVSDDKVDNPANSFIYPVEFYRKYISTVVGSRCSMYPTCSKYCIDALKKHGSVVGYIMTCDRLMRCGRDEVRLSPPVWINGKMRCYDPVRNNDFWWEIEH
jgi:putative membrane protein insertion efficiency factor